MSETSTETSTATDAEAVPVVLAEEQLLQLATAVATGLTAYFEAKEKENSVVVVTPVEVTVAESVPVEEPADGSTDPVEDGEPTSPDGTGEVGTG